MIHARGAITDCPMAEAAVLGLIAAHNDPNIDTRLSFEGTELLVHTSLLEAQKEATNRARKVAQTNESEEADTIGRKVITRLIPGDKLNEVAETIIQSMGPEAVENQQVVQSKNLIFTTLRTTQLAMDMIRLGSQEAFAPRPTITELARPKRQFVVDRPVDSWQSGGSQGTWQQQSDTWQSGGSQGTARESVYGPAYDSWTGSATNQQAGWGQGNNTVGDLFGQADQSGSNGFRELREAQKKDRAEMDVMRRTLSKVEHSTDKVIMNQAALETMLTQYLVTEAAKADKAALLQQDILASQQRMQIILQEYSALAPISPHVEGVDDMDKDQMRAAMERKLEAFAHRDAERDRLNKAAQAEQANINRKNAEASEIASKEQAQGRIEVSRMLEVIQGLAISNNGAARGLPQAGADNTVNDPLAGTPTGTTQADTPESSTAGAGRARETRERQEGNLTEGNLTEGNLTEGNLTEGSPGCPPALDAMELDGTQAQDNTPNQHPTNQQEADAHQPETPDEEDVLGGLVGLTRDRNQRSPQKATTRSVRSKAAAEAALILNQE